MKRALVVAAVLVLLGCEQGREGDRCNPNLSHDECGSGLACGQPENCPESYCCPTAGPVTSPFCEPGCNGGLDAICAATDGAADGCSESGAD